MRTVLSAILALVLFTPVNAPASEIFFRVTDDGDLPASFGLTPFTSLPAPFIHAEVDGVSVLDGEITSSVKFVSGPLVREVIDPSETVYTYGPGTLTIMTSFYDRHGVVQEGGFIGSVPGFDITVCEGCDTLRHASKTDEFIVFSLGPGMFDAALAHELGIYGPTTGGSFDIGRLIDIDGGPASRERVGFSNFGDGILTIDAIPEPSLLALYLTFGGVALARRRRSRPSARV